MIVTIKLSTVLLCITCLFYSTSVVSQIYRSRDIGLFVGTSQYNGDVNMTNPYYSPHWTAALHLRKTYNYRYSWRVSISYGELKGYDTDFSNKYQQHRKHDFTKTHIYEMASLVEFNFFDITPNEKDHNFSPVLIGGAGIFYSEELKLKEMICFPVGLGLKYKLASNLELMAEWTFRKTYTDKLDQLDADALGYKRYKQISFNKTNDWYSLLGVTLLINFMSDSAPCHIYDKKGYEIFTKKRNRKR